MSEPELKIKMRPLIEKLAFAALIGICASGLAAWNKATNDIDRLARNQEMLICMVSNLNGKPCDTADLLKTD